MAPRFAQQSQPNGAMSTDSRHQTWQHIHEVQFRIWEVICCLQRRAFDHDQSKLRTPELEAFDANSSKLRDIKYGSQEYKESLGEMAEALENHYRLNDHHPEHHPNGIHGMSLLQLLEMLADWKAASMRHEDGDLAWSINHNAERFGYGDEMREMMLTTALHLGWI